MERTLRDLAGIGPAMMRDFEILGIQTVEQLARRHPKAIYDELCRRTATRQDICVLDVFTAAVAQARDPKLSEEQKQWWYWSRVRKAQGSQKAKRHAT
jgi:predicted RecB family nuclease